MSCPFCLSVCLSDIQANPSKFQAIVLNRQGNTTNLVFNIDTDTLKPNTSVKLLGVHLDNQLNFNEHIRYISTKCAKQVNAMARLSRMLSTDSKMNILIHSYYQILTSVLLYIISVALVTLVKWNEYKSGH